MSGAGVAQAERLCDLASDFLDVAGSGVTVVAVGGPPAMLCCSNPVARQIEDLQYTIGEGPGIDAHATGRPVAEPDLGSPRRIRWPVFAGPAVAAGAGALFSFPLRMGAVRLGALTLYQPRPGGAVRRPAC